MALLTLDQVLGTDDREYKDVEVPEWGGTIRLRPMSAAQRDQYEWQAYKANKDGSADAFKNIRAQLVRLCWVDEDGKPVVAKKDLEKLGEKSAKVINYLFDECRKLNGLTEADVEELEGN